MEVVDMYAEMLDVKAEEIKSEVEELRKISVNILSDLLKLFKSDDLSSQLSKDTLFLYKAFSGLYVRNFVLNADIIYHIGTESLEKLRTEVNLFSAHLAEVKRKAKIH